MGSGAGFLDTPSSENRGGQSTDNQEDIENEIAENIFDWWISGLGYDKWYANKFLQQKIDFGDDDDSDER